MLTLFPRSSCTYINYAIGKQSTIVAFRNPLENHPPPNRFPAFSPLDHTRRILSFMEGLHDAFSKPGRPHLDGSRLQACEIEPRQQYSSERYNFIIRKNSAGTKVFASTEWELRFLQVSIKITDRNLVGLTNDAFFFCLSFPCKFTKRSPLKVVASPPHASVDACKALAVQITGTSFFRR